MDAGGAALKLGTTARGCERATVGDGQGSQIWVRVCRTEPTRLQVFVAGYGPGVQRVADGVRVQLHGFCPSRGARCMAENAAMLVDEVFSAQPVRQWVLYVPMSHCAQGFGLLFTCHPGDSYRFRRQTNLEWPLEIFTGLGREFGSLLRGLSD